MAEVVNSEAVIGTLEIMTYPGKVLFDTGETTSFMSREFIDVNGLECKMLARPITIMFAGGNMSVT